LPHAAPGIEQFLTQPDWERRRKHPGANSRTHRRECADIVDIQCGERRAYAFVQTRLREKIAICVSGRGETARHRHAEGGEARYHLAERGILAADEFHVGVSQLFEWDDVRLHAGLLVRMGIK
jgi:hypothetical protein